MLPLKKIGISSLGLFLSYGIFQQFKLFNQDYQHNQIYRDGERFVKNTLKDVKEKLDSFRENHKILEK